jgi:hypothetical protein
MEQDMSETATKTYLTKVVETPEGLAVDFPQELFNELNFKHNQVLVWAMLPDNKGFVITPIEQVS